MQYFDFRLCIKHKQNHVLAKRETISICESKTSKDSLTNFSWCNDFPCTYLQCRHYPFQLDPSHKVLIALWQALHQKIPVLYTIGRYATFWAVWADRAVRKTRGFEVF